MTLTFTIFLTKKMAFNYFNKFEVIKNEDIYFYFSKLTFDAGWVNSHTGEFLNLIKIK
jgi:hypothetical protein